MSEGYEEGSNGFFLVRVRAQVMMRDDSTGGWLPMGGGGLSNVSVRKHCSPDQNKCEYLIFGRRISDQSVVLSCLIKKDFEYNKVMPTFHHWRTGDKKFGLTFQTAADARAFDKGVRMAVEELLQVHRIVNGPIHLEDIMAVDPADQTGPLPGPENTPSPHINYSEDQGDEDVFMALNLPVERGEAHSSSDSSSSKHGSTQPGQMPNPAYNQPNYTRSTDSLECIRLKEPPPGLHLAGGGGSSDNYSYVQLTAVHEYIYPVVDDKRDSLKKRSLDIPVTASTPPSQPALPTKKRERERRRCRHCQEFYSEQDNVRGSCEYAPDCAKSVLDGATCIKCASCMIYHCMADSEGDFVQHPCECNPAEDGWTGSKKRWIGLAILSLVVPCLCCYPPFRACHWCCVACGVCGGRHEPVT